MVRLRDEGKIDRIFDAALKLVLSQGYTGLKMPDVAHRAGLASGTLYIYFKNKKDLINQLYLKLKYEEATLLMAPYRPGAGFLDNFRSLWYGNIQAAIQSPERTEFLVQFLESDIFLLEHGGFPMNCSIRSGSSFLMGRSGESSAGPMWMCRLVFFWDRRANSSV